MISVRSSFHSDSHRFVSVNNHACFILHSPIVLQVSLILRHDEVLQGIAAGIGIFQLSTSVFHSKLEFLIFRINEKNTT